MTKEQVYIIRIALQDKINDFRDYANIRDNQGNEESRAFFLEQANEMQEALEEFLKENPTR